MRVCRNFNPDRPTVSRAGRRPSVDILPNGDRQHVNEPFPELVPVGALVTLIRHGNWYHVQARLVNFGGGRVANWRRAGPNLRHP